MKATSLRAFFVTLAFIVFFWGLSLYISDKSESHATKKSVAEKLQMVKRAKDKIDAIKLDTQVKDNVMEQIITLLDDYENHQQVGKKLSQVDIQSIEERLNLIFPKSYVTFLEYFGNGGAIYNNTIVDINKPYFLSHHIKNSNKKVVDEFGDEFNANSLLCLTKEDTNKGIWCWMTNETKNNGEWPLVYFNNSDQTLYYKINNFSKWLNVALESKKEVIKNIDPKNSLVSE